MATNVTVQPRHRRPATPAEKPKPTRVSAPRRPTKATKFPIPKELDGKIFVPEDTPTEFVLPDRLPTAQWEVITPSSASALLELNTHNRPISNYGVQRWIDELQASAWKLTGEAIIISDTNVLFDGQHRLKACVDSGITFISLVVRGVPEDVFAAIDVATKRTAGQILKINGVANATLTAGMAKAILAYRAAARGEHATLASSFARAITNRRISEAVASMPGLEEFSLFAPKVAKVSALNSPAAVGGALYQCYLMDPEKCQQFIDGLLEGVGLQTGDARLTLRNRASVRNPSSGGTKSGGANAQAYSFMLILGAFRAFVQEKNWLKAQVPQNLIVIGPTGTG